VAAKLLSLLSGPAVDVNEVADLIGSDATFTARLLQRVNSAQFGFVSDITNVRRAVGLLGFDTTRQVVLAHATAVYVHGGLKTETMRRCWQHTVATAVLAEEIAVACNAFVPIAFTAGIMHDIGRLGLLVAYPEEYERVIRNAAGRSMDVLEFEAEEFGAHHAEAGRMLAELWSLPSEMGVIAGRHHDPCEGSEVDLLRIVHVACRLADVLGYDVVKPLVPSQASDVIAELPATMRASLVRAPEELFERIEQQIREFGSEAGNTPPEETLALLASVNETENPEQALILDTETDMASDRWEAAASKREPVPNRTIILWILAALAGSTAVVLWVLR